MSPPEIQLESIGRHKFPGNGKRFHGGKFRGPCGPRGGLRCFDRNWRCYRQRSSIFRRDEEGHFCLKSRSFSRCQSRSFSLSRLSWSFLPLARPISSLARPRFQYMAVGTRV